MSFIKLQFKPGVNRDQTDYSNEGGWYECDKIRFRSGYPEKIGGWVKSSPFEFSGVCRQMWNWITTFSDNLLAIGTNDKVYIEAGGNYYDITPLRNTALPLSTPGTNNCINTTNTSTTIVVNLGTPHNATTGSYVQIAGVAGTTIGGVPVSQINGNHEITVIDADSFSFVVTAAATSTVSNAGGTAITIEVISTPDTDNCINTTNTSTTIVVNLGTSHDATTGSYVQIAGVAGTTIGGVPVSQINGNHQITVIDANSFSFVVTTAATSTVSNAGGTAITIGFEIAPGNAIATGGYGWGAGAWGRDAWGLGTSSAPIFLPQRDWWFDNFDNDLVMNIRNGEGYWWVRGTLDDPITAYDTKAIRLSVYAFNWAAADPTLPYTPTQYADAVPSQIMQLLVSQQDRHLLAFGAVPFGSTNIADFDPLLIRWADQDTPENWIPQQINTAGDLRVSRGSKIVRALPTRQEILVWTDTNLYTLQFLGTADVFGLQEYADNISIASPRAMASAANITYWMGQDKFYAYTGRVETLPCTLRNHVFKNLNYSQAEQIVCGTNEQWNEVWWFYPTANSNYNNAYVIYNHLERIWYYGSIERTAWLDTPLRQWPQAANTPVTVNGNNITTGAGFIYDHEDGVDDDVVAMDSYIQSSDFDLDDGDQLVLTRRIIPDIGFEGSTAVAPEVSLQIRPRNFPGSAVSFDAADTQRVIETSIGVYTDQVFMRARARQMAFKIRSQNLGVQWQLGAPRIDGRVDGKR